MPEQPSKSTVSLAWVVLLLMFSVGGCSKSPAASMACSSQMTPMKGPSPQPPEALLPDEASVPDDAAVIGVSTGIHWRAYLIDALREPQGGPDCQVVNDLLGDVPVTVTYCAYTNHCRVLTSRSAQLLNVTVAGRSEKGLEILVDGQRYGQSDPGLPLDDYTFQTTSWGNWKVQHPQSDIYIGRLDEG